MSDTTNIDDLPTNEKPNISMEKQEKPVQPQQYHSPQTQQQTNGNNNQFTQLSQEDINKIVSGVQTAGRDATSLPTRDIPMNQTNLTNDENIQPNYVPKQEPYIQQENINHHTLYQHQREKEQEDKTKNKIFDELQIPIIISILFFIFQVPIIDKKLYKYIPSLFLNDGNMSMSGFFIKSILFGLSYFILIKGMDYFSDM